MEKASRKQTIFNSKPCDVSACILPENKRLNRLKDRLDILRTGLPKYSPHWHRPLGFLLALGFQMHRAL